MADTDSVVAVFTSHQDAEAAIKELQQSGFDMKKLSIVGKDYHSEENVIGYYNLGDRVATWGKFGAFWGWNLGTALRFGFPVRARSGTGNRWWSARFLAGRGSGDSRGSGRFLGSGRGFDQLGYP